MGGEKVKSILIWVLELRKGKTIVENFLLLKLTSRNMQTKKLTY